MLKPMPVGLTTRPFLGGLLVFFAAVSAAVCCAAQDTPARSGRPVRIAQANAGFNGAYKAGRWTALTVELQAAAACHGTLSIVGHDGDGVLVRYLDSTATFELSAAGTTTLQLLFQPGSIGSQIEAEFHLDDGTRWREPVAIAGPLPSTSELIVVLGPSVGAEDLPKYIRRGNEFRIHTVQVGDAAGLPERPAGYDGVDWLIMPASRAGLIDQLSTSQADAVREWVWNGGRLIVTAAARAQLLFGDEGPWKALAPGEVRGASRLRRTTGLDTAGGTALDLDPLAAGGAGLVADLHQVRGHIEILEGGGANDRPLAVRTPHGFGQVIFLGIDLDQAPWSEWGGRPNVLKSLILAGRHDLKEDQQRNIRGQVTHLGYEDLTGQLRAALEQFRSVAFLTFTAVAVIAGVYLVCIGPLDYFLAAWLRWPRHATWFTVAAMIAVTCAIGGWLAARCHGTQPWVNQVEIVDIDLASGRFRGAAWVHLYSPVTKRYDLTWQDDRAGRFPGRTKIEYLTWQGLAGRGLGGLNTRSRPMPTGEAYEVHVPGATAAVTQVPIPIAGTKAFSAAWQGEIDLGRQTIAGNAYGLLTGAIENPLPVELTDCIVAYGEHLYRFKRPFGPGQKVILGELTPLNLESRLTQRKIIEQKDMATPWDPSLTDVPRIVDMLMFHEAANGAAYTGMVHRFQSTLDLSDHVRAGRAVLAGRCETPLAQPMGNAATADAVPATAFDQRWTYYRLIVPVQHPARSSEGSEP